MANSAAKLALEMQKIASNAQVQVQQIANEATTKSFDYNAREAATSRDWQKMMSDTSHQREVEDLKKAGLNPILSAGGNGAQSYTTSSASAQAADASSAVSNLAASRMGAAAQGYSAYETAKATRVAAAQSAAATRYAASQQAAATRYAAAMQYQTQKDSWQWKTDYMKAEYGEKVKFETNRPASTLYGLIDKYAVKTGLSNTTVSSNTVKGLKNFVSGVLNNPNKLFKDNVTTMKNNYSNLLTGKGVSRLNTQLRLLGIKPTKKARNKLINACFFGSAGSFNYLIGLMPKKQSSSRPIKAGSVVIR